MDGFSPQQLEQLENIMRRTVREEMASAGLRIDEAQHQDASREDFRFLRRLRLWVDGTASKIGWLVIAACVGAVMTIFGWGLNFWRGG